MRSIPALLVSTAFAALLLVLATNAGPPAYAEDGHQGDVDCNGHIDSRDGWVLTRFVMSLSVPPGAVEGCPNIGTAVATAGIWGDLDCDGAVQTADVLAVHRFVTGLAPLPQVEPCPDIGQSLGLPPDPVDPVPSPGGFTVQLDSATVPVNTSATVALRVTTGPADTFGAINGSVVPSALIAGTSCAPAIGACGGPAFSASTTGVGPGTSTTIANFTFLAGAAPGVATVAVTVGALTDDDGFYHTSTVIAGTITITAPTPPPTPVPATPTPVPATQRKGDFNCDGRVNGADYASLLVYLLIHRQPRVPAGCTPIGTNHVGDLNCDGRINATDLTLLTRYLFGLRVTLPPGCPPIG